MRLEAWLALGVVFIGAQASAAVITVNSASDAIANDGLCNLREAITAANSNIAANGCSAGSPGADTIAFNISGDGPHTITTATALPVVSDAVLIDGLSQPGAQCASWPPNLRIELSMMPGSAQTGLWLSATGGNQIVRGLVINGHNNAGGDNFRAAIRLSNGNNNLVYCNFLGTNVAGSVAVPNRRGIDVVSSANNIIGSDGTNSPIIRRNLISSNINGQISLRGANGNLIAGNYFGTDVNGTAALGGGIGIGLNASDNIVGYDGIGNPSLMRNVIGGLTSSNSPGVDLVTNAQNNRIAGNWIGLGADGTTPLGLSGPAVSIGSNATVQNNLIGWSGTGRVDLARNVLVNSQFGVRVNGINGADHVAIVGNLIGRAPGGAAMGNTVAGIELAWGGDALVALNDISANPIGIRLIASGSGRVNGTFLNGVSPLSGAPLLDSVENCIVGNAQGVVTSVTSGATFSGALFEDNWWGAATGPNTSGADTSALEVDFDPWRNTTGLGCNLDDVFSNGFESE